MTLSLSSLILCLGKTSPCEEPCAKSCDDRAALALPLELGDLRALSAACIGSEGKTLLHAGDAGKGIHWSNYFVAVLVDLKALQ